MERVVSWSLRTGCDMPESSEPDWKRIIRFRVAPFS